MSRHRYRQRGRFWRWLGYTLVCTALLVGLVGAGLTLYAVFVATPVVPASPRPTVPPRMVVEPPPRCPPGFAPYFTENGPRVCVRPISPTSAR